MSSVHDIRAPRTVARREARWARDEITGWGGLPLPLQAGTKIDLDDFDLCVIRRKIHEFYSVKKEIPTIKKLWTVLKVDINFPGGRESLRLLLHKMGYKFKKCRSQRQILIERFDIVAWREKYLTEIDSIRRKSRPIVYLDESFIHTSINYNKCWQSNEEPGVAETVSTGKRFIMVHAGGATGFVPDALLLYNDKEKKSDYHESMNKDNFKKWVTEKLIPNLDKNSCVVMDNARYHSFQVNKAPNTQWKKGTIVKWLDDNNISYPRKATIATLLVIVRKNKPDPKYEIDELLKAHGHTVMRLPPYHCDFNPIEMIWGIVKNKVASKNVAHGGEGFLDLVKSSFQVPPH
ncbi:uncharacterized protein LOC134795119 [Cydia splendana]|uniref:uncharacterized protein LOC134795119 n=1 Tax=Cydia splendana TaxID=1100963 RepID=UPI00300C692C